MRCAQGLADKAMSKVYLLLPQKLGNEAKHSACEAYFAKCAEIRPYVVVTLGSSYATVTMDTYCFSDLDEQARIEAHALFANIAKDREFFCNRNYFEVKRVPVEDAVTLAKALVSVALRSISRSGNICVNKHNVITAQTQ